MNPATTLTYAGSLAKTLSEVVLILAKLLINGSNFCTFTYDHRLRRTGHPVRSANHKPQIGRSIVEWVTISEYLLLYVFRFCFWRLWLWRCWLATSDGIGNLGMNGNNILAMCKVLKLIVLQTR